MQIINIIRET